MKIFDWMHRRMKHDMNYYSKVPHGKGGTSVEFSGRALENKSTDQYFGARQSAEALLLVELSSEAPAAAAVVYHVLGLDGILTIGTLGSSADHQCGSHGSAPVIPEEEEEDVNGGEEKLVVTQQQRAITFVLPVEGKTTKSVVLPTEKPVLETMPEVMPLQVVAPESADEEKYLVKPLLEKAGENDGEDLAKGRTTLRDLFLMSDDDNNGINHYSENGYRTTMAMIRNDSSLIGTKDGHSAVLQKIKNADMPPADKTKLHQCNGKLASVVKEERDGASSKFRRLIRRMTRKKIHPDGDLLRAEAQTFLAIKDMHKGSLPERETNENNITCAAW